MDTRIEVWRTLEQVAANEALWRRLYGQSSASAYLSFDWFYTALSHFGVDDSLRVVLVMTGGMPIAIVPLQIHRVRVGSMPVDAMRLALDGWAPRNGIVAANVADELALCQTVVSLLGEQERFVWCRLGRIADRQVDCRSRDLPHDRYETEPVGRSVVIELPATWSEYKRSLSKAHREGLVRKTNRLFRVGVIEMNRIAPGGEFDAGLLRVLVSDALAVCRNSWQYSAGEGWNIADPNSGDFFTDVCLRLARAGELDLSVLYLDGQPISFIWGAARGQQTSILKLGFDQAFADVGPGAVHLGEHIRDSIERGLQEIDFGHEFFAYKKGWGRRYDLLVDVTLYPPGAVSRVVRFARQLRTLPKWGQQWNGAIIGNFLTSGWA